MPKTDTNTIPVVNVDANGNPQPKLEDRWADIDPEDGTDTSGLTLFRHKPDVRCFGAAFTMYPLSEQEFTDILYVRAKNLSNGENNPGGEEADEFFRKQLDANDPNVFTLLTIPYEEWPTAMESMGFSMSPEALGKEES